MVALASALPLITAVCSLALMRLSVATVLMTGAAGAVVSAVGVLPPLLPPPPPPPPPPRRRPRRDDDPAGDQHSGADATRRGRGGNSIRASGTCRDAAGRGRRGIGGARFGQVDATTAIAVVGAGLGAGLTVVHRLGGFVDLVVDRRLLVLSGSDCALCRGGWPVASPKWQGSGLRFCQLELGFFSGSFWFPPAATIGFFSNDAAIV